MQKKVKILFYLALFFVVLNFILIINFKYTGKTTSEGTISLFVEVYCGDGVCNGDETCSTCPGDCGVCPAPPPAPAPSPGGGGGVSILPDFEVEPIVIKVAVQKGESFKIPLKIINGGTAKQNFFISLSDSMQGKAYFSDNGFLLGLNEEKTIYISFFTSEDSEEGVFTGKVFVKGYGITKQIPVILEVTSKEVLFDISLDIPAKYKELLPGEDLLLQLTLFNLGGLGKVDVSVEYLIKDLDGNIVLEASDVVAVETQASFQKSIKLPSSIESGDYVAIAYAKYGPSIGSSSVMFHVLGREFPFLKSRTFLIILAFASAGLIFIIILLLYKRRKKKKKYIKRVYKKPDKRKSKISEKLSSLESSKEYISGKTYSKIKKSLKGLLTKG
jgi:hypothetical protein